MSARSVVAAEKCPECGSFDVKVIEPRWFAIELDRRSEIRSPDPHWVECIEFGCRDCSAVWA
jgi:hypothetical protein